MLQLDHLLKVIDPEPLQIAHQACLVARHQRSGCSACIDACPATALERSAGRMQVDAGRCQRCGLCAAACPTGAIAVRGIDEASLVAGRELHCAQAEGSGQQVPCLGALTPDHLIELGQRYDEVTLCAGDCAGCQWHAGGAMAEAASETARAALQAMGRPGRITLQAQAKTAKDRALSRRDLFKLWRVESTQVVQQMLPERTVNPARLPSRLPARRSRWVKRASLEAIPAEALMPQGPWRARTVSDACTGCSICTSFCPTGALARREEDETWILTHQPAACVGCGTCEALCPVHAIGEEPVIAREMAGGAVRELTHLHASRCQACRQEFKGRPGETYCPNCRSLFGHLPH